jgi:hypothetical protein
MVGSQAHTRMQEHVAQTILKLKYVDGSLGLGPIADGLRGNSGEVFHTRIR